MKGKLLKKQKYATGLSKNGILHTDDNLMNGFLIANLVLNSTFPSKSQYFSHWPNHSLKKITFTLDKQEECKSP